MDFTQALLDGGLQATPENLDKCDRLHKNNPKMSPATVVKKVKQEQTTGESGGASSMQRQAAEVARPLREQFKKLVVQETILGGYRDALATIADGTALDELILDVDYQVFVETMTTQIAPSTPTNQLLLQGTK